MNTSPPLPSMDPLDTVLVPVLNLVFDLSLQSRQISQWRGAFIEMAGREYPLLHNHQPNGASIYQYPRIHYRCEQGKAAIYAFGEGVTCVQEVLSNREWTLKWQGKKCSLAIQAMKVQTYPLVLQEQKSRYRIKHYLALNQENYLEWSQKESLLERVQTLERLLRNHVLASIWGLGWNGDAELKLQLIELEDTQQVSYHGNALMAFDLVFTCNAVLPPGLAVGKAVSFGFGVINPY